VLVIVLGAGDVVAATASDSGGGKEIRGEVMTENKMVQVKVEYIMVALMLPPVEGEE